MSVILPRYTWRALILHYLHGILVVIFSQYISNRSTSSIYQPGLESQMSTPLIEPTRLSQRGEKLGHGHKKKKKS